VNTLLANYHEQRQEGPSMHLSLLSDSMTEVPLTARDLYLHDVKQVSHLTGNEGVGLLCQLASCTDKQKTQQARERLVEAYQLLVIRLATYHQRGCRFLTFLDLVQEGNLGLLQAVAHYDAAKHQISFAAWVVGWVRGAMLAAYWRCEGAMRVPIHRARAIRRLNAAMVQLMNELGCEPTVDDLAKSLSIATQEVQELLILREQQVVNTFSGEEDNSILRESMDSIPDNASSDTSAVHEQVAEALETLSPRERCVVELRYGFADGASRTIREVASVLGLSTTTVKDIDTVARIRLRAALKPTQDAA
jgi:RNA polymerase primary sigma factor